MASITTSYRNTIDVNKSDTYRAEEWTGKWSSHDMTTINGVINRMKEATFTYDREINRFKINYKSPQDPENFRRLGFDINSSLLSKDGTFNTQIINNDDLGKLLYIEKNIGKGNEAIRTTLQNAITQPNTPISVISVKPVLGKISPPPQATAKTSPPPQATPQQAPVKISLLPPPASTSQTPAKISSPPLETPSMSQLEILRAKVSEQKLAVAAKAATEQQRTPEQEAARIQKAELRETINKTAALQIKVRLQKEALKNAPVISEDERQRRAEKALADAQARAAKAKEKPDQPTSETSPMPPAAKLPEGWIKNGEYYFYKSDNINPHIKLPPTPQAAFGPPLLPSGWEKKIDTATQVPYYSNAATRSTQWNYPFPPLADGWIAEIDPVSQVPYFINVKNGVVGDAQWDFPGKPVAPVAKKYYKY